MPVSAKPRPRPAVDPDGTARSPELLIAEAKAHARRRRRIVASLMLLALVGTLLIAGLVRREASGPAASPDRPAALVTESGFPWCVTDPSGREFVVGAGPPVRVPCQWRGEGGRVRLLHHSGSTLLSLHGSIFRVRDGRLTALGDSSGDVRMSHDGRYAAWLTNVANSNCGGLGLEVYEVSTASQVAVTPIDGEHCGHVQGIDDLGRVYVSIVRDDQPAAADVRMYDIRQRRWSHVSGLPQTPAVSHYSTTYVTADGFAVAADEHAVTTPTYGDVIALSSIEGRVDNDGRFVQPRPVPIGHGLWSPDRSLVVDQRLDGVVVRPANDLRYSGHCSYPPTGSMSPLSGSRC